MKTTMIQVSSKDLIKIDERLKELKEQKRKVECGELTYLVDKKGKMRQLNYLIDLNERMLRRT